MQQNGITPSNKGEALQRLIVEDNVLGLLYARHNELKDAVAASFTPGEKHDIKNDQGLKLGSGSMSSPNKVAVSTDESALRGMADERGMELVDALPKPGTEKAEQAIAFLFEHAPELLDTSVTDEDHKALAKEVLEEWQVTGRTPIGWEIRDASRPRFTLRKTENKVAKAAVRHLASQIEDILAIEAPTTPNGEQ